MRTVTSTAPWWSTGVGQLADRMGVELVAWPDDEARRQHLARAAVPRLLLVAEHAQPPSPVGIDEDWVRLPADERDLRVRLERLARIVGHLHHDRPVIDGGNVVHYGGAAVTVSAAQAALVGVLLAQPGRLVGRAQLESAVWPDGTPGPKALDGLVFRLRRRLAGLGLAVRSGHGRGFALDVPEPDVYEPTGT